ncbi:hypothetical protein LCGC14_1117520 [marine sediment metagenome]|uniref:Uncharacterized protein n=1 Tax=marine sediment metagenome TaxID=412755 RepID=A0A0F9M4X6_9ZZZZ
MKAFKKYWTKNNEHCFDRTGHFDKRDAKSIWRAALEWVLKKTRDKDTIWGIKRELEDK